MLWMGEVWLTVAWLCRVFSAAEKNDRANLWTDDTMFPQLTKEINVQCM